MAPAAAETLVALGVAGRIVAVGDFIDSPPETRSLPRLGAYNLPNAERLVELEVDLLITAASEAARGEHGRLDEIGVHVLALDTSTFAGALASIAAVGDRVGRRDEARKLVLSIEARVEAVRVRVAGAPRPRVLVAVGHDPLYVAGPGSHLDELVAIAGGQNVAADAIGAYSMMAVEAVLERRPEIVVDSADNRSAGPGARSPATGRAGRSCRRSRRAGSTLVDPSRLLDPRAASGRDGGADGAISSIPRSSGRRAGDFGPPPSPKA